MAASGKDEPTRGLSADARAKMEGQEQNHLTLKQIHLTAEVAEYAEEDKSRVKDKTFLPPLQTNTFNRRGRREKEQTECKQKPLFKASRRFEACGRMVGIGSWQGLDNDGFFSICLAIYCSCVCLNSIGASLPNNYLFSFGCCLRCHLLPFHGLPGRRATSLRCT